MLKRVRIIAVVLVFSFVHPVFGEDIELKNGKILYGYVSEKADKFIRYKDGQEELEIPYEQIKSHTKDEIFEEIGINDYIVIPRESDWEKEVLFVIGDDRGIEVVEIVDVEFEGEDNKKVENVERFDNGSIMYEGVMRNGKGEGLYKFYYEDGSLESEVNFKGGHQHGAAKRYYNNGNLKFQCDYNHGDEKGLCLFYNEDGTLAYEKFYDDENESEITKAFKYDGNLWYENKNDVRKIYYPNGKLKSEVSEESAMLFSEEGKILKEELY